MKLSTPLVLKPSHVQSLTVSNRFLSALKQFGKQLIQLIVGTHEVQIWQVSDRAGNVYWRVYDPVTKDSTSFGSSSEVRIWLEQRYYR
ncbi:hypothetical protein H6G00_04105 [Leptolyngbya sp. FACHB-541]|uniref:hypothetical protein n=1 Tax=Leptolyngbya sp. FACHB-541 TaxID=2692810 RepID=UPI0016883BDE|nr:hypothetical protein [Leptolyngbya sp. FACHB-541]MBD1995809.1 hypothetical protein [Leptolyngbya sp. FACHB-541]